MRWYSTVQYRMIMHSLRVGAGVHVVDRSRYSTGRGCRVRVKPPAFLHPNLRHASYMDDSGDEYDAYDLSEFSATDFTHLDATAHEDNHRATASEVVTGGAQGRVGTSRSGGPQIAVALEPTADESVVVKAAAGTSRSGDSICAAQNADERRKSRPTDFHPTHNVDTRSPFERHRSNGTLSVSNLIGPAWYVLKKIGDSWL